MELIYVDALLRVLAVLNTEYSKISVPGHIRHKLVQITKGGYKSPIISREYYGINSVRRHKKRRN